MSKNISISKEELEAINMELYKVQNLAKALRLAVICTDYTNLTMSIDEIGSTLEVIEHITDRQTYKIMERL